MKYILYLYIHVSTMQSHMHFSACLKESFIFLSVLFVYQNCDIYMHLNNGYKFISFTVSMY